jgi:hypothetical protein
MSFNLSEAFTMGLLSSVGVHVLSILSQGGCFDPAFHSCLGLFGLIIILWGLTSLLAWLFSHRLPPMVFSHILSRFWAYHRVFHSCHSLFLGMSPLDKLLVQSGSVCFSIKSLHIPTFLSVPFSFCRSTICFFKVPSRHAS